MKFIENIADFILGNVTTSNLPEIAVQALEGGLYSDSLCILAGLPKDNNAFEVMDYYNRTLKELKLTVSDKKEAALILLKHYIRLIAEREIDPVEGMRLIVNKILGNVDEDTFGKNKEFAWDCINMHMLYGLYWNYNDISAATIPWDKQKTNEQLMDELKEDIVKEAKKYQKENF